MLSPLRPEDAGTANESLSARANLRDRLGELFLCANMACAMGYALSLYMNRSAIAWSPRNSSGYYFLRGAVRVSDLLHLGVTTAVSSDTVARRDSILWNYLALGITFAVTLCAATAVLLLLVRGFRIRSRYPSAFRLATGVVALFAAQAGYIFVLIATRHWSPGEAPDPFVPDSRVLKFLISVLIGEFIAFAALLMLRRRRGFSPWSSAFLLLLHSVLWGVFLFDALPLYLRGTRIIYLYLIHSALWLVPSAGAVLLLYVWPAAETSSDPGAPRIEKWTVIPAALGAIALLLIWIPARNHSLAHPKDLQSASIELSRGPCFGPCPVYTVRLHGNGDVEFVGKRFVRVKGIQTANLSDGQFLQALEILDRAHFAALDDRAFSWCFDTDSVSVAISLDGNRKLVSSDASCSGAKSGVQAQFVQATEEIDKLIGSERWVMCEGRQCR